MTVIPESAACLALPLYGAQSASPVVIPNHHRNRNAPNGAAAETG
jgi:hypothetical protein